MSVRAPFTIERIRLTKNGLHMRLISTWGTTVRCIGALVLSTQPQYFSHMPAAKVKP